MKGCVDRRRDWITYLHLLRAVDKALWLAAINDSGLRAVNNALFEAMPKRLRPNIAVAAKRAKVARGPRITWLNRCISLYFDLVGLSYLRLGSQAALLQVRTIGG